MGKAGIIGIALSIFVIVLVSVIGSIFESKNNVVIHEPRTENSYVIEYRSGVNGLGNTMLRTIYSDNVAISDNVVAVHGYYEWKGTNPGFSFGNNPYDWIYTDNLTVIPRDDCLVKKYIKEDE